MFWLALFGGSIFLVAYGNAMLGAVGRRAGAVARNQKHSVTGEPLVEFDPKYVLIARVVAWGGGIAFIAAIVAFAVGLEPWF